jgi:ABC-type polysaccharide/polyol phosphate export permease
MLEVFRAPLVAGALPSTTDFTIALASALCMFAFGSWVFAISSRRIALYL